MFPIEKSIVIDGRDDSHGKQLHRAGARTITADHGNVEYEDFEVNMANLSPDDDGDGV